MHELIASPFLEQHMLVRPGDSSGLLLPEANYEELRRVAGSDAPAPPWLLDAVRERWGTHIGDRTMTDYLLVREPSAHGYSRASWEINLGCNYQCKHCYLGLKVFSGMSLADKLKVLEVVRDAGVLFFQITGGEPTVDKHFMHTYEAAFRMGMMLTVSTNASLLWRENLLSMFERFPPYRVTVSMYGATKPSYDELTQRKGAWDLFQRGMTAAREAGLPLRLSIIVTEVNAHEEQQMIALAEHWGIEHNVYTNMTPTIYGGAESLTAQSKEHLRMRKPFTGCNAGHTFFHVDPHGLASICKIGRDDHINLVEEGLDGLARLGAVADRLMLRTGGCSGCTLAGQCVVCRPLAKHYQEAGAQKETYCQHGMKKAG
ncbi:radical SAM protein [Streptomyces sp. NPDC018045]|uniref:radical SAM protein n=1 Tax=Streptomyces sp. NPDC018045 TaxID=3365037 RepID=UPI0037B6D213